MTIYFVSRHPGARAWAQRHGVVVEQWVTHLDPARVQAGDTVIGSLPVNLVGELCALGARYLHLSVRLPGSMRGRELSADELDQLGARIVPYQVSELAS